MSLTLTQGPMASEEVNFVATKDVSSCCRISIVVMIAITERFPLEMFRGRLPWSGLSGYDGLSTSLGCLGQSFADRTLQVGGDGSIQSGEETGQIDVLGVGDVFQNVDQRDYSVIQDGIMGGQELDAAANLKAFLVEGKILGSRQDGHEQGKQADEDLHFVLLEEIQVR